MAGTRKLTIEIVGDASSATAAFKKTGDSADSFGKRAGAVFAGIGAAAAAREIVDFAKDSIAAFTEAEQSQAKLSDAFAKFPQLADGNIKALQGLNTELATKTKFDDDATAAAEANLAQFGLTQDQLTKLIPLVQDYAARTGKDLATASTDVGKAILGQGRALKEVGIKFQDTGSSAGNFNEVMTALNVKVGGFAESEGKTAAGQAAILGNQFQELQEKVGSVLLPALLKLSDILISIVTYLMDHQPVFIALVAVVGTGLVVAFTAWAISAITAAAATIAATWPVIAITVAVAALAAGIIWAYENVDWFRGTVDFLAAVLTGTVWPALQAGYSIISTLVNLYLMPLRLAIEYFPTVLDGLVDAWQRAWGTVAAMLQWVWDHVISPIVDKISGAIDSVSGAASTLGDIAGSVGGAIGGVTGVFGFSDGGLVPGPVGAPMLATVHGGEYVLTADQVSGIRDGATMASPMGGGSSPTVNVYLTAGMGVDGARLGQQILEVVENATRNGVRPGASTVAAFAGS